MAGANEDVNHRRLSPDGGVLSTKFRVEPEHLRRSTRLMRESDRSAWRRMRERLRERGIDPAAAAVANISVHEPDPQNPVLLLVRGHERTVVLYSPRFDSVQEVDGTRFLESEAVQTAEAVLDEED